MRRLVLLAILLPILLANCSGIKYVYSEYGGIKPVKHTNTTATYRIFDKPPAGKMMITPTLGRVAGLSYVKGLTLGLVDTLPKEWEFKQAAESYLKETSRPEKRVTSVWEIIDAQWEAVYE